MLRLFSLWAHNRYHAAHFLSQMANFAILSSLMSPWLECWTATDATWFKPCTTVLWHSVTVWHSVAVWHCVTVWHSVTVWECDTVWGRWKGCKLGIAPAEHTTQVSDKYSRNKKEILCLHECRYWQFLSLTDLRCQAIPATNSAGTAPGWLFQKMV